MVARTPPKRTRVAPLPLNPVQLRETVKKVDRCMARLQELQYVVAGGKKVVSGVSLSPRSTRSYLKTSLRCKQESLRQGSGVRTISPTGKFEGGWKRMSLPAMLVGETVGEIIQASQFAREIVQAVSDITQARSEDPKTPLTVKQRRLGLENTQLRSRRKREKQNGSISLQSSSPKLQRVRSRINFKVSPPKKNITEEETRHIRHTANKVSPRHKPWAKKAVLFPNPLFTSTSPTRNQPQRFCRTRSPVIARNKQTPHKFLIKSPASSSSKFQVKVKKSPPKAISPIRKITTILSPTRPVVSTRRSPKTQASRGRSPARLACCIKTISPPKGATTFSKRSPKMSTASKLRRSLSPARLANRLMSPLKSRKPAQMSCDAPVTGPRPRPTAPMRFALVPAGPKPRPTTPLRFFIPGI